MIDTHTHLYMGESYPQESGGPRGAVERAIVAGVHHMVMPNVDVDSVNPMLALHREFPDYTSVAIGLHPTEVKSAWRDDLREIRYRFDDTPYVAWGEIGVDLYWDKERIVDQMDAFGEQLQLAYEEQKPVIIHSRDAWRETFEVLGMMGENLPGLLFHSFTSGPAEAKEIMSRYPEALFGINGVATFKNAREVREAIKEIGIDRIVLETDSPYLAPTPFRGRTNESAFIENVCNIVADTLQLSKDDTERITDSNAVKFFHLKF